MDLNAVLAPERRPNGFLVGHVFRTDWEDGEALYAPWDRKGLSWHSEWAQNYPADAWHSERDIAFFLERVHKLLNTDDYEGLETSQ